MARIFEYPNQGTPGQGEPCSFPCFGNVGPPFIATLSIPGLTIWLPTWFFSALAILNAPNSCQEHQA